MNIISLLIGSRFDLLIEEGKQINQLIRNGGEALLKSSSPEQENALNIQWYKFSLPNPFSIGIIIVQLILPLVWGWESVIYYLDLSIPLSAILSLSILPFMGVYIAFIPYTLGRGYTSGLLLIRYFYLLNILMTLTGFFLTFMKSIDFNEEIRQLYFFPLQLLVIYLCRHVMNSNSFYKIISFFRTTRLLLEAKKAREKQEKSTK
ncbi:TPA: hypothetical protein N5O13_000985 [Enterobacter cloacae subsp. cloacae]|nr:hypothetical protein [Enterobacter cloacae subsp. cloacae]